MESMTSSKKSYNRWSKKDQALFVELHKEHEIAFDKYLPFFPGRTETQIKSFYHNVLYKNRQVEKRCEKYQNNTYENKRPSKMNDAEMDLSEISCLFPDPIQKYNMSQQLYLGAQKSQQQLFNTKYGFDEFKLETPVNFQTISQE
ncbi:SANT/Myb_domain [Hexamita inflata]|uniref:SANT/Myb domain n=1 Tax=Hexamita inflata TaxID=28002 RepID=A0AA86UEP6_9EUKA|nr:SANT/Myb domain [Hexamita inflata]